MSTQANQIRPGVKLACVATLFGAIVLLVFFAPQQKKPISPVTIQATQAVVTPAEETSNQVETGVIIRTRIQFGVGISTNGSNNQ